VVDALQIVGICAATASVASFFPQAWKIIKSRDVESLSSKMYALTALSFALWLTFGWLKSEWALIVPNLLCLVATLFILAMIMLPRKTRSRVADTLDPGVKS
jgi:MtN3 and saliva related transmembrane protein